LDGIVDLPQSCLLLIRSYGNSGDYFSNLVDLLIDQIQVSKNFLIEHKSFFTVFNRLVESR